MLLDTRRVDRPRGGGSERGGRGDGGDSRAAAAVVAVVDVFAVIVVVIAAIEPRTLAMFPFFSR